jgi:hypothetical protein
MLHCVALVRTDLSEELKIGELGTTLAVTPFLEEPTRRNIPEDAIIQSEVSSSSVGDNFSLISLHCKTAPIEGFYLYLPED